MTIYKKAVLIVYLILILLLVFSAFGESVAASSKRELTIRTSIFTHHWKDNDKKNNNQNLLGFEVSENSSSIGVNYFVNSYKNDTYYFYVGRDLLSFNLKQNQIDIKLTDGVMKGYEEENINKHAIKLKNDNFLVIIPCISIKRKINEKYGFVLDTGIIGSSGIISTAGVYFSF